MKTLLVAIRLGLVVISATPAGFFLLVGIGSIFPAKQASAQALAPAVLLRAGEALETETPRLRERGLELETPKIPRFEPREWGQSSFATPREKALVEAVEGGLGIHDEPWKEKDPFSLKNFKQESKKFFPSGDVVLIAPIILHRPAGQYVGSTAVEKPVSISSSPENQTNGSQVLRGNPVDGCPLSFLTFNIHHYRIAYQRRYLGTLANEQSPLRQDVCECRLMPGDYATCARQSILSSAAAYTGSTVNDAMSGGVEVFVTDPHDFENLFAYVLENVPVAPETLTSPGPPGDGNGNGGPPAAPPPQPTRYPQTAEGRAAEENGCERSGKICISTKGGKISAEFKVKCKNMPEYSFSTGGEASIKVGPIGVSFSPE